MFPSSPRAALLGALALLPVLAGCPQDPDPIVPATPAASESTPPAPHQTVRSAVPEDINDKFLDPASPVEEWSTRWEVESREVFACRDAILAALHLAPGKRVADVGTGTGLFLGPMSRAVGDTGKVFAVDIAPKFVEHVRRRAEREELHNVEAILSNERSAELAAASVDAVLICDTYHHFEYHEDMLRSLKHGIRPGGHLVVVDFERIPGVSREWILGHVRAGKEVVTQEVTAAGFELVEEIDVAGFEENYLLRFLRKPD